MLLPLLIAQPAPAFMRSPDIFGNQVAYTSEGDIWLGDLQTRKAFRLTRDVGLEMDARFSPDGSMIAYSGELDGIREIYVMPVAGGAPKRLTYLNDFADMIDWRDSNTLVFRARNYPSSTVLYTINLDGGEPQRLPMEFGCYGTFGSDRNVMVYNPYNRLSHAWFRYQGGMKNPLWTADLKNLKFTKIYEGEGSAEFPVWTGDRIYFTTYSGGDFHLSSVKPDGSGAKRETPASEVELRYLQGDGKRLIFERGMGAEVFDPATGKATPISFETASDYLHTRSYMVPAEANVLFSSIGPTGKRVLVESRGQIVSLPVKDGDARVLVAKDGVRFRNPVFSPDGKKIAYFSDESGEQQLVVADADGNNAKTLSNGKDRQLRRIQWAPDSKTVVYSDSDLLLHFVDLATGTEKTLKAANPDGWQAANFSFSPDSKWLAFGAIDFWTRMETLSLYELSTGTVHKIGTGQVDDFGPQFSPDGKFIAFFSRRNFTMVNDPLQNHLNLTNNLKVYLLALTKEQTSPFIAPSNEEGAAEPKEDKQPFRIDLEGLYSRFIEVPLPAGDYAQLAWAGDRLLVREGTDLKFYDVKARKAGALASNVPAFSVSDDQKKVLLGTGANLRVIDAAGGEETKIGFGGVMLRVEPRAEWKQIYWDAWRFTRDYFYVKSMHGADWPAIGKKYAAYLPAVRSRDELDHLIRWVQSEAAISHSYLSPGDTRSLFKAAAPSFLGADFVPGENGYYKIAKIYRGMDFDANDRSALALPGMNVKEGDYLIEVGGRPAKVGSNWKEALLGRAGQMVSIKVNSAPTAEGARTIQVKPAASEARMRWWDWVENRKRYVDQATGGKVAYVYLRAMGVGDMGDFVRQYFPQRNKQALIIDTRFNNGGWVSDLINTILKQTGLAFWNQRNLDVPWTRQADFFPGPMVCIQNEFNVSDGEEFPYYFKALKLGPIVGRRSRGGEVGSDPGWPLVDGGSINVPNYGMFSDKGWEIEGRGVEPDIDVLNDPNAWARGKDPQLDKAIHVMLEQIAKNPFKLPKQPADPVYIKPGKAGGGG